MGGGRPAEPEECDGRGVPLRPLPPDLGVAFTVRAAREQGVARSRMRASDLRTPYFGVRTSGPAPADDYEASVRRRIAEFAPRMRQVEYFCLVAAAVIWDAPVPARVFWRGDGSGERPLDIGVTLPARASRVRGVSGRSVREGWATVRSAPGAGLPVTSPASTWAMMAELLERDELIVLGDYLVREPMRTDDPPARATIAELDAAMSVGRRRGIAALREALPFIRTRSRSARETMTRLLIRDAGMPEPDLNWPVEVDGVTIALIDLAFPELKLGFEYEGEQHLIDPSQWAADIRRYEALADLGWRIIRLTKADLAPRYAPRLIARMRAAYAAAQRR